MMKLDKILSLALMTLLLAPPVASGMLVLCLGSDGHVAVESASEDDCCREWARTLQQAARPSEAALATASGPCCDDLELFVEAATLTGAVQKAMTASLSSTWASALPASAHGTLGSIQYHPADTQSAASLRSIVLLA